ncbi:DUF47 domain-containing protein [Methanoregula sp. UBA64]|jgi:uncharacterized protein|uniref:DUF47 domain-containing protein n=1 Tax=Methanoregula sp. UBA64 TaxID=1915554 RepID=UPI0025EA8FD4|nr:DUF47 family protein [Methanoregula sp. UBA64]
MRIRDLILPEDQIFFALFKDMAQKINEASATLNEITHELPEGIEKAHKIRQIEHLGDEVTRHIYERLNESLITPLEPDEIARLAPALDDVLDKLDWVAHQLATYELTRSSDVLKEYSYLILMTSNEIVEAVDALADLTKPQEVHSHILEISRLYNLSSELLSRAILEIFKTKDLLMIIKLKDIYESLAKVMEKCNDVGHALSDISMSHT